MVNIRCMVRHTLDSLSSIKKMPTLWLQKYKLVGNYMIASHNLTYNPHFETAFPYTAIGVELDGHGSCRGSETELPRDGGPTQVHLRIKH